MGALAYLDWVSAAFTISGILLLAHKRRAGWVVASIGSVGWLLVSLLGTFHGRPIFAQTVLSVVTICTNIYGFIHWKR